MSVSANSQASNRGAILPIAAVAVGAIAFTWWLFNLSPSLDHSVLGVEGFAEVAQEKGDLDIRFFGGEERLKANEIGLRILPLYDPNVSAQLKLDLLDKDENNLRPMHETVFINKIQNIQTLVILPKWQDRAIELQKLHPDLLIPNKIMRMPYDKYKAIGTHELRRGQAKIFSMKPEKADPGSLRGVRRIGELSVYLPQTISNSSRSRPACEAELTYGGNILLAQCHYLEKEQLPFWLLTDPDIINNHGAGNGDNYQFAVDLASFLADGKPIIVDGTNKIFTGEKPAVKERERSFADLARFFKYPFSFAWIAFVCLTFFTLWHAWRRVGPVMDRDTDDEMRASKATVIEANVSILRGVDKSGTKDSDLARAYVTQRMASLSADLFGAGRKSGSSGEDQLFAALERRDATLAGHLKTVRTRLDLNSPSDNKKTLFDNLKQFEKLTKEARHEFGRPSNPR